MSIRIGRFRHMQKILLIDDEVSFCESVTRILSEEGYNVKFAGNASTGIRLLGESEYDLVLLDHFLPDINGLEVLPKILAVHPSVPVIIVTGETSIPKVVEAVKNGVYDYITKPFERDRLVLTIHNALKYAQTAHTRDQYRDALDHQYEMIGQSTQIKAIRTMIDKVAPKDVTVLVTGESGTGKELVARALHKQSNRNNQAYVHLNCAAIPENLLESELFGHVKGAFTGAYTNSQGRFYAANKGTLFLDEIGEMSLSLQAKLLRVLQTGEIQRVGASDTIICDVRIIAATNKDLKKAVEKGSFREDLFYRLDVINISVAPLRERKGDIPLLLDFFMNQIANREGTIPLRLTPAAVHFICGFDWPGNIRELESFVARLMCLHSDGPVDIEHVRYFMKHAESRYIKEIPIDLPLREARDFFEKKYIHQAIGYASGNISRAAELLGIDRRTLYRKMEGHNSFN